MRGPFGAAIGVAAALGWPLGRVLAADGATMAAVARSLDEAARRHEYRRYRTLRAAMGADPEWSEEIEASEIGADQAALWAGFRAASERTRNAGRE